MYYISTIEQDLIDYLNEVNQGQNYSGVTTTWADIVKHYAEENYAILAHSNYLSNLATLDSLDGWHQPINYTI